MQPVKFLTSVVVLFVWGFLFEQFLAPIVYGDSMSTIPGLIADPPMMWIIIGSLVGAAVLVWVYEKVAGSFGPGARGGAMFGLYAGILTNFPMWLFFTLYVGWPYRSMWHWTLVGIVMGVINGVLIGLVYDNVGGSKAA